MRSRIVAFRQGDRATAGTTLVELLVAMAVFGIAMVMITTSAIAVQRVTKDSEAAADAVFQTRQALATIDKQVRSGNVLFSPSEEGSYVASCQNLGDNQGSCMRIFTQANGAQKCVQWQVVSDGAGAYQLEMRSWAPSWTLSGEVTGWSIIARGLAAPSSTNIPFTLDTGDASGPEGRYGQRLLRIHMVAVNAASGRDVALDASLSGRNTTYGYSQSECVPVPAG